MMNVKLITLGVVVLIFFVGLFYISYNLIGWVNYKMAYQDRVVITICETVKREHLKDPSLCR